MDKTLILRAIEAQAKSSPTKGMDINQQTAEVSKHWTSEMKAKYGFDNLGKFSNTSIKKFLNLVDYDILKAKKLISVFIGNYESFHFYKPTQFPHPTLASLNIFLPHVIAHITNDLYSHNKKVFVNQAVTEQKTETDWGGYSF